MKIQKKVDIFLGTKRIQKAIELVQYDTGIQLVFNVVDFDMPENTTATLYVQKPSGKFVYQEAGISVADNTIVVDLENQAIAESGIAMFQITLINGTDTITTFKGTIKVEVSLSDSNATESETVIKSFNELTAEKIAEIQTATQEQINSIVAKGEDVVASIPQDYTKLTEEVNKQKSYVINSIDYLSEIVTPKNLYNPYNSVVGYRLNSSGGNHSASGYFVSDYMPVTEGKTLNVLLSDDTYKRIAFYDEDKTFLSIRYGSPVTVPANAVYARFCDIEANRLDAYAYEGQLVNLSDSTENNDKVLKGYISLTVDNYARYDTGAVGTLSGVNLLEMAVVGGETLQYNFTYRSPDKRGIAFYSADGSFISGVQALTTTQQVTVPSNATKMKATVTYNNDVVLVDRIQIMQGEILTSSSGVARHYHVGAGLEYTTIKSAVEEAVKYENSVVHIQNGDYDLIEEFGAEFFENFVHDSTDTSNCGLLLGNGIKLIFSPKANVTCVYSGDNADVGKYFAAFNSYYAGGFTIDGLNITASGIRYAIHEDIGFFRSGVMTFREVIIRNCHFVFSNTPSTNPTTWRNNGAIGGGLSNSESVLLENCIFETSAHEVNSTNVGGAFYHQSGSSVAKSRIVCKNCYFVNPQDTFYTYTLGNTTLITDVICTGNSMKLTPYNNHVEGTSDSINFMSWNNEIRN